MRRRLDVEMVRRGVVASRSEAALAIAAGKVTVGGRPVLKSGTLVLPGEAIALAGPARRFVSRGGEKLEAALDRFDLNVAGQHALDAGSSTGGFTDCLLSRGAAHVVAVDVGYGQLHWRLRKHPRVTVLERTNVRDLRPRDLPYRPGAIAADLSFISLGVALPALAACASPDAHFVLLVKPQFEAGRGEVGPGGVVTDPGTWSRVIRAVAESCRSNGLTPVNVMASPLLGPAGNAEFLLWASSGASSDGSAGHTPAPLPEAALDRAVREAIGAIGRSTAAGGGAPRGYRGE